MSEQATSDQLVPIYPLSPEWAVWLTYNRGTKNEALMLACLGSPQHGRLTQAWYAPSRLPPAAPCARNVRPEIPTEAKKLERRGIGDGDLDGVANRLIAKAERDASETAEQKKRRKLDKKAANRHEEALLAARENRRPNVDEIEDFDIRRVEDPNEAVRLEHVGEGPPMRVPVKARPRYRIVALRDDPIGQMAKRRQLGNDVDDVEDRLAAARKWQELHEHAEIGGARGIDPSRDIVDGGRYEMPETEDRLRAHKQLIAVRQAIGIIPELRILGARLLTWVLAEKLTLKQIAELHFDLDGHDRRKLSLLDHLKNCLDVTAVVLNVAPNPEIKTGPRARPRDKFDRYSRALDRFDGKQELQGALYWAMRLNAGEQGSE
jgi:hypothetical protein